MDSKEKKAEKPVDTITLCERLLKSLSDNPLDLSELFNFDLFKNLNKDEIVDKFQETSLSDLKRNNFTDLKPHRQKTKRALIELTYRAFAPKFDSSAQIMLCHLIIHQQVTCPPSRAKQLAALAESGLKARSNSYIVSFLHLIKFMQYLNIFALEQPHKDDFDYLYYQIETDEFIPKYLKHINNKSLFAYFLPSVLRDYPDYLKKEELNDTCVLFAVLQRFSPIRTAFIFKEMSDFTNSTQLEIARRALPVCTTSAQETFELALSNLLIIPYTTPKELREAFELVLQGIQKKDPTANDWLNYGKMGKHFEWAYFHALHYNDKQLAHDFIYHAVKFYQLSRHDGYLAQLAPAIIRLFTLRHVMEDEKSNYKIRHTRYLQLLQERYPDLYEASIQQVLSDQYPTQSTSSKPDLDTFIGQQLQEDSEKFIKKVDLAFATLLDENSKNIASSQPSLSSFLFTQVVGQQLMNKASYPPSKLADHIKANIQIILSMGKKPAHPKQQPQQMDVFFQCLEDNIKHTCKLITSAMSPIDYLEGVRYINQHCDRNAINYSILTPATLKKIEDMCKESLQWTPAFPTTQAELLMIAFLDLHGATAAPTEVAEVKNLRKPSVTRQEALTTPLSYFGSDKKRAHPPETTASNQGNEVGTLLTRT